MDPYIGEIRMFAGNFAPVGWILCDGRLLPISEYDTLFVLVGTTYGGDGQNTFALPDLRGRAPVHFGQGPGLSNIVLGEKKGNENVTLTLANVPQHTHRLNGIALSATTGTPSPGALLATTPFFQYSKDSAIPAPVPVPMNQASITSTGNGQPMGIMQPFLAVNYIIASNGIFPSRQ
ncbi:MAG: tail fiber protein [Pedobacter sp.]|nr:tail fiber protein [Pedobacter sp.]